MFISIEGIEGSGKSTFSRGLAERLASAGISAVVTREPGGCSLGLRIRPLLLDAGVSVAPLAELHLFLADRAQHVAELIRPALAAGTWVLCDRYADSTVAYQGFGRGMDAHMLKELSSVAAGGLDPDVTFLLDLPEEEGLRRARTRNGAEGTSESEGRFEAEELSFHRRIRGGFLSLAGQEPERFVVLDALLPPDTLADRAFA
ncbi:MAG: dTMP kinase, partial [Mailhella sp.]|nr:dTMP kinase [Mailhella sp.]